MSMELNTIKDAFDCVTKKQKLSFSKAQEIIDQINQEIEQSLQKLESGDDLDYRSILSDLKTRLRDKTLLAQTETAQKELNSALTKYPKLLEKSFNADISRAYRNTEFDKQTLHQIIADHFYRQGLFEAGDCFTAETHEPELELVCSMKPLFEEMFEILEAMKRDKNLKPALKWAAENSDKLRENGSDLLLKLHSLQFVEVLQSRSREEALSYARAQLSPFASDHMVEIQRLVVCLLWAGKLEKSPYSQLLSPANWVKASEELTRQFCNILGQSHESPLNVAVAAGGQGLPPLLKFMAVMVGKRQEWQTMKQLPVPVELDQRFQFHSVFVCPVSKEQSTDENPPMMMQCGHVLCKQSVTKMSKNGTRSFKCPYCPSDVDSSDCRQLYF